MGQIFYQPIVSSTSEGQLSMGTTADRNFWELVAGASNKCRLLSFEITSAATSAQVIRVFLRFLDVAGTPVTTLDPETNADMDGGVPTATVAGGMITPNATTDDIIMSFQWDQLGPLGYVFTPEMAPICDVSNGFALECATAPSVDNNFDGFVCWEEL